jgi:hypothetical protein
MESKLKISDRLFGGASPPMKKKARREKPI